MLKFGKIIDLDDLERDADRTKEKEAEKILQIDIQNFNYSSNKLLKSIHTLEEELSEVLYILYIYEMSIYNYNI